MKNLCVLHDWFYQKSSNFLEKLRSLKTYPKKQQKYRFFDNFGLQNPPKTPPKSIKKRWKIYIKIESEKMRQNERQERPRPPQQRGMKSTIRDIPPAPLSFCSTWPPKTLKRFPEPVAPRRDRKALGIPSWHNSYSILSYAIFFYIMHLMLS